MAYDALQVFAPPGAQTTGQNHTALDLRNGTPTRGMVARVLVTAVSGTAPTMAAKIQHSDDNITFDDLALCESGTISAVGEYSIRFSTKRRYVRLATVIAGTTPSFTYESQLGQVFP